MLRGVFVSADGQRRHMRLLLLLLLLRTCTVLLHHPAVCAALTKLTYETASELDDGGPDPSLPNYMHRWTNDHMRHSAHSAHSAQGGGNSGQMR